MPTPTLEERISTLESQVAELRGLRVVKPSSKRPVNEAAYRKALDCWMKGNDKGKAIKEYKKIYAVPDLTATGTGTHARP